MKRISLLLLAVTSALVAAQGAAAKGPIEASIDGPGLATPIQVGDWSNWGEEEAMASHQPIMQLAEAAGFFAGAFGSPALASERPRGELGARYVATYGVPGPSNDEFRIVQHLYPYAEPSPVTYMPPGQKIFERDGTPGGWYVADDPGLPQLLPVLTEAGLPGRPPGSAKSSFPSATGAAIGAAILAGTGALGIVLVRRRLHPAA